MTQKKPLLFLLFISLGVLLTAEIRQASPQSGSSSLSVQTQLTSKEKDWLANHKDIRIGVDPVWPPFEFFDATKVYSGIASDYVRRLNESLNINMEPVPNLSWPEVMSKARAGEIDVLPCVAKTPERSKFMLFSEPYISFPMVILTREDASFVSGIQDFENGKVAVVKGYVTQELLQRDYPDREFYLTKDIDKALRALSRGKTDAFVGNLASITYTTQKLGLTNLKVATSTQYKYELAFAVRKDWPELVNILNKSLHSIPHLEKAEIHNRWINVRFERKTNWALLLQVVVAIVLFGGIILVMVLRWNQKLSMEISERQRTEVELLQSRAAARGLLDATQESLLLLDSQGNIIAANTYAARQFKKTPADIIGINFFTLLTGEFGNTRKVYFDRVIRSGIMVDFEDTLNGSIFQNRFYPVKNEDGQLVRIALFSEDMTEQKRAEEALKGSEARMRAILDTAVDGIIIINEERIVEKFNPAAERMFGYKASEVVGQNVKMLMPEPYHSKHDEYVKNYLDNGKSKIIGIGREVVGRRKDGTSFPIYLAVSEVQLKNRRIFSGIVQDISELKQAQEELRLARKAAEKANKAKGDFLANMSHEIRTPMNAVMGLTHLALKTKLTPRQRDYLNKIDSSANSLLGIINDILDFSKIEAGKLDIESVEFNLDQVLENLANLVTVKASEKENIEVLFNTAIEVPRFLIGDSLRLGQILINLANNAVKFTEAGDIIVSTEVVTYGEDKVTLKFSVSDTGIGLSEEQMAKLFHSFSQADTSTTRKFGGTGLGLAISKRLTEMMGGKIWIKSKLGQGSTFSFTAKFGIAKEKVKKRLVPSQDLQGIKIMVVDDNASSRQILENILNSFSFEVVLAASGEECLAELESAPKDRPYDLVIMDWKMPGIDGIEASKRIKHHKSLGKIPPVILVTAYGHEDVMQQAKQLGLEGFLLKPVSQSLLFDAIMQAMGHEDRKVSRIDRRKEDKIQDLKAIYGARVLLVEDNEINQQVAIEILEGAKLHVSLAENGEEAVSAVKESNYDVVLMDIQMPVMNGYETTKAIRKWEAEVRKESVALRTHSSELPIIAMTAHAMAGDEEKSKSAGMNDHVTKPINPDQLFTTLLKWINPNEVRVQANKPEVTNEHAESDAAHLEDELPEYLPGFDLKDGLNRLRGNQKLYRKLLLNFSVDHNAAINEIRHALDAEDFDQAHGLVHNLKGLAGNLSATKLHEAAVSMEKLFKGVDKKALSLEQLNLRLLELENALNQAFKSVQSLGVTAEEQVRKLSDKEIAVIPAELAQDIAKRIGNAAQMGDIMTLHAIAAEIKMHSDSYIPLSNKIVQLAEVFDLEGIEELAEALVAC